MNISELKTSRFLKKEDVGDGVIVTITNVTQENVAQEGAPAEMKWCAHFKEVDKPIVLNATNGLILATITGSEESDGWIGKRFELFNDLSVVFQGKVGGLRFRKASAAQSQAADPAVVKEVYDVFKKTLKPDTSPADAKVLLKETVEAFYGDGTDPKSLTTAQWRKMGANAFQPPKSPIEENAELDDIF